MRELNGDKIVFLPGLDGTGISFEPLAKLFPPTITATVITYPNEKQSFEETVNCAAAQFPADEGILVVAESFSGGNRAYCVGQGKGKRSCPRRNIYQHAKENAAAALLLLTT